MFSLDPFSESCRREDDFESAFESIEDTDLENESRETSPRNEEEVHLRVRNNEREIQSDRRVKDTLSEYSTFHGYKIQQSYDGAKVEAGLRVVRPQVGKYKSSDNFGVSRDIGTIVNVSDEGDVTVQWDMDESNVYRKRKNNQYALLLLDNAQTGIKHTYVECGGCNEYPLRGIRWKCFICANVNLCTRCYMDFRHDLGHRFKRMLSTNSTGVLMTTRNKIDWICAVGIMPTSVVQLRSNSQKTGKVIKFLETKIEAFRSNANVVWENPSKRQQYRVGTNGHCDLQFTTPATGPMYYEDHLPVVTFENVKKGARVVRGPSWNDDRCDVGHGCVGTVTHVKDDQTNEETISKESSIKSKTQQGKKKVDVTLQVQWDNGKEMQLTGDLLRLFDNGPSGVEHVGYFCCCCPPDDKINIRGIRWKCTECTACDMCNICYMSNRHDERHKFQRIIDTNMREKMTTSRDDVKSSYRQSFGIFKGATVDEVAKVGKMKGGKIDEICNCHIDNGRSEVEVSWTNDETTTINRILDLKNNTGGAFHYYHSHLPALGNDNRSYFEVMFDFDGGSTKKIQIEIWRLVQQEKKLSLKPSLFLIFANHPTLDKKEDKMTLMEEVIDFARRTHLPCYVVGQRVCFHHGSTSTAFIHYKTEKDTVKELVKKGFRKFRRGDMIDKDEDEIHYFIRMTKYVIGETVLPVIISFRNGGITKDVLKSAVKSKIPVIRFKKHSLDVSVLTAENIDADACVVEMTENRTDIKNPWSVRKYYKRCYELGKYDGIDDTDEVAFISEIQSDFRHNLDALICYLIIGVSMTEESLVKKVFGRFTHVYPNALSMHLLKEGNWRIPKEHIKKYFNSRSIDYIYEEDMTSEIKKGLWSSLKSITNKAYTTPDYREDDIEDSDYNITLNQTELTDLMENTDPNLKIKGCNVKLQVSTSELYGLIFLALLQKKYWLGAQQLIETGCIRIHHILIGCAILDDVADHWTTSPFLKEKLQRLKKAFTQRAIRITSCINDTDKKKEDFAIESKENYKKNKNQKELGDYINHAGRLLMNHGCIDDAVKTKNKMFLDNGTVKDILNKMWYDTEELDYLTILCFISLAAGHMLVLPLLMINMEARPLLWFYKKFKLPFMKVFMHMLGFLALLAAYAYMLLFDYSEDGITNTDYFIIFWMASFFVDENKQHIIAIIRKKWKVYANDWWNRLEWLSIMVYTTGMLLKLGEGTIFHHASKVLLVAAFVLFCIRILKLCCISAILGPKLVMIQKMFLDTLSFMIIMTVIMMCYNISFYALLYPNSEFSWRQIEKIIKNGYWMLFGELNLDVDILTEPDCTFNRTIYESGILQQCPTELGVYITPYLKAIYGLIAVILMLNLLIAMYSRTFSSIQQESELYWSQLQADFLEEYSIKTIFPIHLQLFVVPAIIIQAIVWFFGPYLNGELCQKCFEDGMDDESDQDDEFGEEATLNHCPMFVRVFLYNTNFDLKLKTTKEAEGNGALKAKGEIDIMEGDRITMLQKQLETSRKQQEKQKETKDRQHLKMITSKLQELEFCLNGIKKSLSTTENSNEKEENEDETVRRARMSAESVRLSLSRSFDNC